MTTPLTIECPVHFHRHGKGGRRGLYAGQPPQRPELSPGRVPRIARLMALAIRFEQLIRDGVIANYSELARLGHVTHARVSQVMNLLHLAPDIQEQLLFLPRTERGRDPIHLRQIQPIAAAADWRKQRQMWAELTARWPPAVAGGTGLPPTKRPTDMANPPG
jgi:hypothetical protein